MRASMKHETQDPSVDAAGKRRRFRFSKRDAEGDLQHLDSIAAQVDDLAGAATPSPTPSRDAATPAASAARSALADLEQRLAERTPAQTDPAAFAGSYEPGGANAFLPTQPTAPEHTMTQLSPHATPQAMPYQPEEAPLESRLEAALAPTAAPAPQVAASQPIQMRQVTPQTVALPETTSPRRAGMLVDVNRIIESLEEEAESARQRIDFELRNAREEADVVLREANHDADRIRDHAQQQARVLLGEVEEIISEAQQTGQHILKQADADSESLRDQSLTMLEEAQLEARKIIDTARHEGEQILAEQRRLATVRAQESMREQDRLKDQIRRLEERRRQVLESLEPLIDQLSQMIPTDRNVIDFPGGSPHLS